MSIKPINTVELSADEFRNYFIHEATKRGVPVRLVTRQIYQESRFNHNVISPAGAVGVCQIMPGTFNEMMGKLKNKNVIIKNIYNYIDNIECYFWYMFNEIPRLLRYYKIPVTYKNMLWCYNAGIGNIKRGIMPGETQNYIKVIL